MTPRFDLVDIAQTLQRRRKFILIITILAAAVGAVSHLLQEKKYKAKSEFIVANPQFADRNNIFRTTVPVYIEYFANEDEVDRVIAIAQSDTVRNLVAQNMNLYQTYRLDANKPGDVAKMAGIFKGAYDVKRTEYKNMEISFTDTDPARAAAITKEIIKTVEMVYRNYYNSIKLKAYDVLTKNVHSADSMITMLTDSLSQMREKYKIYDLISPARQNIVIANLKPNGTADYGKGVEQIQNLESIKDQYVTDRAHNISAITEFETGTKLNDLSFIQVISPAVPPTKAAGLGTILTIVASALIGLFVAVIITLFTAYFNALTSVER